MNFSKTLAIVQILKPEVTYAHLLLWVMKFPAHVVVYTFTVSSSSLHAVKDWQPTISLPVSISSYFYNWQPHNCTFELVIISQYINTPPIVYIGIQVFSDSYNYSI